MLVHIPQDPYHFVNPDQAFVLDDRINNSTPSAIFSHLVENKSYVPISACVFEHILATNNLTHHEKLYYLLVDSLALINKNTGYNRVYALSSEDWAASLNCSRALVFAMQSSIAEKGYFIIKKAIDEKGRDKRNIIIPTLPIAVFNHLQEQAKDIGEDQDPYNPITECMRSYLDRTKGFVKLNYNLLKLITSSEHLNPQQKVLWLSLYTKCYKNYIRSKKAKASFC